MDKSDVITKPKFLTFTGYQILLAMGLRASASGARSSAIIMSTRYKIEIYVSNTFTGSALLVCYSIPVSNYKLGREKLSKVYM